MSCNKGKEFNISDKTKKMIDLSNCNEFETIICDVIQNLDDYFHRKGLTLLIWN